MNIIDGEGISVSYVNGNLVITNTMPNRNSFKTIRVLDSEIAAKHPVDTLVLAHDSNIGITIDAEKNQISFSLNADEIRSNINSLKVNAEIIKIRGNLDETNKAYSDVLTQYHKIIENAVLLRNAISNLRLQYDYHKATDAIAADEIIEQIANLETQLLKYDIELSVLSKRTDKLARSIHEPEASFTYNATSKTVHLDKALSAPFILENLTTELRNRIVDPEIGRLIFNTTDTKMQVFTGQIWADLH